MTIQTNTTDRKALAKAIAEALGTTVHYMGMPTCNYSIGDYMVDRQGNIIGDDFTELRDFLLANGYITEDALTAETEEAEALAKPEAPVEEADAEPNTEPTENTDDSNEEQQTAETTGQDGDTQTVTLPAPDITVEQLRNLTYILYSRQYILNLMTGEQTIAIPVELVEALKEALPATPEDFTTLLHSFTALGLKGYDFKDGQFTLTFPFYEDEPTKWTTFAGLQGRILQMARTATRVFPELMVPEEEAEKYTAHMWLQRMGYKGPEMKEQRNILLKHLHGYCAFSNGAKMQNHKDKYSAIRRERREAERAAASGEPDVEVTMPTTEADPEKEVASND